MPDIYHGLIVRQYEFEDTEIAAVYSKCGRYKYELTRTWNPKAGKILFVMLNPSTGTEMASDPTVVRCEHRSRSLGYGSLRICNLFAWINTDPEELMDVKFPVGPQNDKLTVLSCNFWADEVVAAWGDYGEHMERCYRVQRLMSYFWKSIKVLGFTDRGHPRHPLYVSHDQPLQTWEIG